MDDKCLRIYAHQIFVGRFTYYYVKGGRFAVRFDVTGCARNRPWGTRDATKRPRNLGTFPQREKSSKQLARPLSLSPPYDTSWFPFYFFFSRRILFATTLRKREKEKITRIKRARLLSFFFFVRKYLTITMLMNPRQSERNKTFAVVFHFYE